MWNSDAGRFRGDGDDLGASPSVRPFGDFETGRAFAETVHDIGGGAEIVLGCTMPSGLPGMTASRSCSVSSFAVEGVHSDDTV